MVSWSFNSYVEHDILLAPSSANPGWVNSCTCWSAVVGGLRLTFRPVGGHRSRLPLVTKASYASWGSSCFSKEYARGWIRQFLDTIRLTPPWRLVTLRSWVQPPSVHRVKNSGIYSVFCITGLGLINFEVFRLPFHLGCLDRLQIRHEEKQFHRGRVLHDGRVGFHLGCVIFFLSRLSYLFMPCPC